MIDLRVLFMKYIAHISAEEGITFISRAEEPFFTAEEIAELRSLEAEARKNDPGGLRE